MRDYQRQIISFALLFLLLSGCQSLLSGRDKGLTVNVIFEDARGLTAGAPLVFQGVPIGEVRQIAPMLVQTTTEDDAPCQLDEALIDQLAGSQVICLSLAVDETNRPLVRTDSDFLIRSAAAAPPRKEIEMVVWDSDSPEMADNVTVVGSDNLLEFYWKRLSRWEQGLTLGQLTIHTEIEEEGAVKRAYLLETGQYLPVESILAGLLPAQEAGWEVNRPPQEGARLLQVSRTFPSAAGVVSPNSDLTIETNASVLGAEYVYTETFQAGRFAGNQDLMSSSEWSVLLTDWYNRLSVDREAPTGVALEAVTTLINQLQAGVTGAAPLNRIIAVITVQMPGEIVAEESNATFVVGRQASWVLTVEALNQGFEARAVARQGLTTPSLPSPGGGIAALLIGGVIIVLVAGGVIAYKVVRENRRFQQTLYDDEADDNLL